MRLGTSTGVSKYIFLYYILFIFYNIITICNLNIFQFHRSGTSVSMRSITSGLRPMTAVRGAGYTSSIRQTFDPLNMSSSAKGPAPPLENGKDDT